MHGKTVAPIASQFVPLVVLTALAGAVWVGLSLARAAVVDSDVVSASASSEAETSASAEAADWEETNEPGLFECRSTALAKRDTLVYLVDSDDRFFHAASHRGSASRSAVSLESATCRGYAPCPVCCRGMADEQKAVVNRN